LDGLLVGWFVGWMVCWLDGLVDGCWLLVVRNKTLALNNLRMKYLSVIFLFLLSLLFSCQANPAEVQAYEDQEGIFVEIIDSVGSGRPNPYNVDNSIYLPEKEYIFDYQYLKLREKAVLVRRD
jgi:hypothetical protein